MTVSTRQLGLLLVLLCAITLTLAWVIERRQILSFRAELDAWGRDPHAPTPAPASPSSAAAVEQPPPSGDPDEPVPFVAPPPPDPPELADE